LKLRIVAREVIKAYTQKIGANRVALELHQHGSDGGILATQERTRSRLIGLDIARAIAIAGMIMVHFGPNRVPDSTAGMVYETSHGRASILFVFLAGIGITFLTTRRTSQGIPAVVDLMIRALILLPLGLWLQDVEHGVLVILQFYALYFLFAVLIVGLSTRTLIGVFAAFLVLGPIIRDALEISYVEWFVSSPPSLATPFSDIVRDLLISGYYPLITWGAPLTLGIIVGRLPLRDSIFRLGMIVAGVILSIGSTVAARTLDFATNGQIAPLLSEEPHSQSHVWMVDAIGVSLVIVGISLIAGDRLPRLMWPLAATGQLALTIYVAHLVLLDRYTELLRRDTVGEAATVVAIFVAIVMIVATAWRAFAPVGPLEALFRIPAFLTRR
jgi:uncharacterized membrane protein YeiB